jgi:predicted phage tail protein
MAHVRIVLHGFLGKQFGRRHRYHINTPAEGYRALCATLPGFEQAFVRFPHTYAFVSDRAALETPMEGDMPVRKEMHIVPMVKGSGKVLRVIAGVVIAVVGAYFGQAWAVQFGAALAFSGVAEMLTKKPSLAIAASKQDTEKVESYFFRGPLNTTEQGVPVPVAYGDVFCGSVVISAGIRTYELTAGQQSVAPPAIAPIAVNVEATQPIDPKGATVGNSQAFLASGGLYAYGWET